jgi:hypothetical protein
VARGRMFSIGGAIARLWRPAYPLLPWALSSALMTVAGLWDYWTRDLSPDLIVLGLAAYELMVGLRESEAASSPLGTRPAGEPSAEQPSTVSAVRSATLAARGRRVFRN